MSKAEGKMDEKKDGSLEALRKQLADVQAQRQALAAASQPTEEDLLRRQLEEQGLALANEQAVAKAVSEHGPIGVKVAAVETPLGVVIVKRPNHMIWRRFVDEGKGDSAAFEKLVRPCVVHPGSAPDLARFEAILEEFPATLARCADAVATLAGVRSGEVSGKS